jgi:hypothetical protein
MDMIQLNMPHYFLPVMSKNLIIYFVELNRPAISKGGRGVVLNPMRMISQRNIFALCFLKSGNGFLALLGMTRFVG